MTTSTSQITISDSTSQITISDHIRAVRLALDRLSEAWGLPAEAETNTRTNVLYRLGDRHRYGLGVPQDYAEAARWYRLAAEQGFAMAQYNLGLMYNNGEGVAQDYAEAARWLRLAAEQASEGGQL